MSRSAVASSAVSLARALPVVNLIAQRSSTSALTDSRQFVVFSDRPSTPYTPNRCNCQGLVQALRQAVSRRLVPHRPTRPWSVSSRTEGLGVIRPVVGALEALPPHRLLVLRRGNSTTFSRSDATGTVGPGPGPGTSFLNSMCGAPCRPSRITSTPWKSVEAPLDQRPQERREHRRVLHVRFDEAQEAFLPRQRDAQG